MFWDTATAEAFNSSNSLNTAPNGLVTVNPRCVKPWIVPNRDPNNSGATLVRFPFQIQAGLGNPVVTDAVITSSNSTMTLPIYDDTVGPFTVNQPSVKIVGFLQVFINGIDTTTGNINVTALNVAGCSNPATDSTLTASGTSPVPIRLITPQ